MKNWLAEAAVRKAALMAGLTIPLVLNGSVAKAADAKEIVIGQVASLTGGFAAIGEASKGGLAVAIDELNQAGGVTVDGTRYVFKVVVKDDQSDPAKASIATQSLIRDDNVKVIFGPDASPVAVAGNAITSKSHVIQFSQALAIYGQLVSKSMDDPLNKYTFGVSGGLRDTAIRAARGITEIWPNLKTTAVLMPNDASLDLQTKAMEESLALAGLKDVTTIRYDGATKDFSPFLTRLRAMNPDLLLAGISPAQETAIVAQAAQIGGVAKYIFLYNGTGDMALTANNGEPSTIPVGWFRHGWDEFSNNPSLIAFLASYKRVNGAEPPKSQGASSAFYYLPMKLLATATVKANSISNTDGIVKALTEVSTAAFEGTYKFSDKHGPRLPLTICATRANAAGPGDVSCLQVPYDPSLN